MVASAPVRQAGVFLVLVVLGGCRATVPLPPAGDGARFCELEDRIARLETQSKAADLEDQILALEVERAGLLVTYTPEHPAVLRIDRKIETLRGTRNEGDRQRHAKMLRQLEAQRSQALVTHTPDHATVQRLDAQIAWLRSDER